MLKSCAAILCIPAVLAAHLYLREVKVQNVNHRPGASAQVSEFYSTWMMSDSRSRR